MPAGPKQIAVREYRNAVRPLLKKYGLPAMTGETLQCALLCHRRLLLKAHPDKGGSADDFRTAQAAKSALIAAMETQQAPGSAASAEQAPPPEPTPRKRPAAPTSTTGARPRRSGVSTSLVESYQEVCPFCAETSDTPAREYRIQSNGVLLTYNGAQLAPEGAWPAFKMWVESNKAGWKVLYYCLTKELCHQGRPHFHLMVQFRNSVDCSPRTFAFNGVLPNARPTWLDYCRQGRNKKNPQQSLDRGFFYVFANKIGACTDEVGSPCVHGNYAPNWTDMAYRYEVLGDWPEKLWRRRQLTHEQYGRYVILCRDRVAARKRNLEEVTKGEDELLDIEEAAENADRIHSNPFLYKPFKTFAVAQEWLRSFTKDALRYSLMLVRGASWSGKTELAKSWFRNPLSLKIGHLLEVFPAKMRKYNRRTHDGIVLDDIRDLQFLVNFQHVFQGKPDEEVGFAENTGGGTCAYSKLVFATPFVATFNDSAKNLDFLEKDDFLSKPENRVILHLRSSPFVDDEGSAGGPAGAASSQTPPPPCLALAGVQTPPGPREEMEQWSVTEVQQFLARQDMCAAAKVLRQNDVCGSDLATMTSNDFQQGLSMSSFLANKVVQRRDSFLSA